MHELTSIGLTLSCITDRSLIDDEERDKRRRDREMNRETKRREIDIILRLSIFFSFPYFSCAHMFLLPNYSYDNFRVEKDHQIFMLRIEVSPCAASIVRVGTGPGFYNDNIILGLKRSPFLFYL